jgi:hypothetical protein
LRLPLLVILVLLTGTLKGQKNLPEKTSAAFLDSKELLFLGDINGNVRRVHPENDEILVYGPPRPSRVSLLDASNPLRIFVFYEDLQEYVVLDRFLTEIARYSLSDYTTYAGLCAPSQNNQLWLIDLQNFTLRKIDPSGTSNEITIPLQQVLDPDDFDISLIREYQNLLFLADRKRGVYIFDNLGNLLTRLERKGIGNISFNDNNAILLQDSIRLIRYDLYSGQISETSLEFPVTHYFEGSKKYLVTTDSLIIRPLKP